MKYNVKITEQYTNNAKIEASSLEEAKEIAETTLILRPSQHATVVVDWEESYADWR